MTVAWLNRLFGDETDIFRSHDYQTLLLANTIPPLGSGILAPILSSLIAPLGTTTADVGLLIAAFTAPAIVMIPAAGVLADRYGRKPVLVSALLLFGLAGTAIAGTTDFGVVLGLRLLQGVAFGGITPVIITSIGDLYRGTEEATAQGVRFTISGLASAVFPFVSGLLVVLAWQYPFLLYALAIPVAMIVYIWFEEPATDADGPQPTGTPGTQLRSLGALVRRREVAAIILARGFPMIVWIGFITYNSVVVESVLGASPAIAGVLVAAGSLAFAVAASQAGRVTAVAESLFVPLVLANACLGVGLGLFVLGTHLVLAGLGVMVAGAGFGLTLSLYRSILTSLPETALRASFVSFAEAYGRVTSTATPVLMGATIALATPTLGTVGAVQLAGLGAAIVGGVGGIGCMVAFFSWSEPDVLDHRPG